MALTLLYFARLREDLAMAQEQLAYDAQLNTVAALLDRLRLRGAPWAQALAPERPFRVAVNQTLAADASALADGDEVALFPRSRAANFVQVKVQAEDFDVAAELAQLRAGRPQIGAIVSFVGVVRDLNAGASVNGLTLEHYPGMTEKALQTICAQASERWEVDDIALIHRIGYLAPCDQIVLVAVASQHRGEAFHACEFIMDFLKTEAPFWKKEHTPDGTRWVEARLSDEAAAARWQTKKS